MSFFYINRGVEQGVACLMCKKFCKTCVLCGLCCSLSQSWNALFKKEKRIKKASVYSVYFDSVLIILCSVVLSFCVCCLCDVCADRGIKVDHSNFWTIFKSIFSERN